MRVKEIYARLAERMADYESCSWAELNVYDQRFHQENVRACCNAVFVGMQGRTQTKT